jgi:DNA-binding NtrC family response regulator
MSEGRSKSGSTGSSRENEAETAMCQRTVLIVEDEILIRMMLVDALNDAGYRVIEAGNVLEAVAALGRYEIDTVVTDMDMPGGLNGLDLARMLSSTHQSTTVIVTSGGRRLSRPTSCQTG